MNFSKQLAEIRKSQGLTQQGLADAAPLHINQIRRYETGSAQPTLEGLIKLAKALHVSQDERGFDGQERGPGDTMKLLFEAVERFSDEGQAVIRELLEGMIVKYESRRWTKTG